MTSTQVELQFSHFTHLTDTRSKRLGLSGLCAKAMNQAFKAWVERWRTEQRMGHKPSGTHRARPAWVKRNEKTKGAFDLYKTDVKTKMSENGQLDSTPR